MKEKRLALLIVLLFLFTTAVPRASAEQQTLLIYMLGCDLETDSGAATEDLLKLMKTSAAAEELSVIVYIGGAEKLWFPTLEHEHCYDLGFCKGSYEALSDLGCVPSAEGSSQLRFLTTYGTDGSDLILWGHGSGESCELGYDVLFDRDVLSLEELEEALQESGLRFRMIGFDACDMASEELIQTLAPFAELVAVSSDAEGIDGWDDVELLPFLAEISSGDILADALTMEKTPDELYTRMRKSFEVMLASVAAGQRKE